MRVYRRKYKDAKGKRRTVKRLQVEFDDHLDRCQTFPAFEDEEASEALGRTLDYLVLCRKRSDTPDAAVTRYLAGLPERLRKRVAKTGLLEGRYAMASKALSEHVDDFEKALGARDATRKHTRLTTKRVRAIVDGCRFRLWSDVTPSKVHVCLAALREKDKGAIGAKSSNHYLRAFKQFARWMVTDGRASENPVAHLKGVNARTDVRVQRRALSADECRRLIGAALKGEDVLGVSGPERALIYRLALETGLRAGELRSLIVSSFHLAGDPPTVTVSAKDSKHRREDVLPLRPETARAIENHLRGRMPIARAFNLPMRTAEMLKKDLTAAEIEYKDASDRVADFHALRHTFVTNLARSGVHPKVAQDLARHSDVNLTLSVYSHTVLDDRRAALTGLPDLSDEAIAEEAKATGTDGRDGAPEKLRPNLTPNGGASRNKTGQNGPHLRPAPHSTKKAKTPKTPGKPGLSASYRSGSGDWTRTSDLRAMNPLL